MRLLNTHTLELRTFYGDAIPQYAILSHNWLHDSEEVTFQQIQHPEQCRGIPGFRKVELLCTEATKNGYDYAWIDTCCIEKTNSSELSEAINSMFEWYKQSRVCYAYLGDIDHPSDDILSSRWWSRAWTLQELIAPRRVIFFDRQWKMIGTKRHRRIAKGITDITGIPKEVLRAPKFMFTKSIAQRMCWASNRQATRAEDIAYSLLGIFDVQMPMQYGEGIRAFVRLQSEILKTTSDMSIFAWSYFPKSIGSRQIEEKRGENFIVFGGYAVSQHGLFAADPKQFKKSKDITSCRDHASSTAVSETNGAFYLELPLIQQPSDAGSSSNYLAILPCVDLTLPHRMVGIVLRATRQPKCFVRVATVHGDFTCLVKGRLGAKAEVVSICIQRPQAEVHHAALRRTLDLQRTVAIESNASGDAFRLINAPDLSLWDDEDMTLQLSRTDHPGMLFELIPQHSQRRRFIKICPYLIEHSDGTLGNFVVISEAQSREKVDWSWDFSGFNVSTEAALLLSDAKIKATAESRRVFHHLITDLTIQVDHYKIN